MFEILLCLEIDDSPSSFLLTCSLLSVPEATLYPPSPRSTRCPASLKATCSGPACGVPRSSPLAFNSFYCLSFVATTPNQCDQWSLVGLAEDVSLWGAAGLPCCRDQKAVLLCCCLQVCTGMCNHNFPAGRLGSDPPISEWFKTICSSIWPRRNTSFIPVSHPETRCSGGRRFSCGMEAVCVGALGQHHLPTEMSAGWI